MSIVTRSLSITKRILVGLANFCNTSSQLANHDDYEFLPNSLQRIVLGSTTACEKGQKNPRWQGFLSSLVYRHRDYSQETVTLGSLETVLSSDQALLSIRPDQLLVEIRLRNPEPKPVPVEPCFMLELHSGPK